MTNLKTVEQCFSCVTDLTNKIRIYREEIQDKKLVEKILYTMLIKFDHVVTTIIESHNTNTMMIAKWQGSIAT